MSLGNDLAGGEVKANPRVSAEPKIAGDTEFQSQENPEIYHACVITRSMALKEREHEKEEADKIVLADTFLKEIKICDDDVTEE